MTHVSGGTAPGCTALLWSLLLALTPLSAAQTIEMADGGTRAQIDFIEYLETAAPAGWIPVGLRIVNRTAEAREWSARFECDVHTGSQVLGEWTLPVSGGATREFTLLLPQPWFAATSTYFQIRGQVSGPLVRNGSLFLNRAYTGGNQTAFTGMSTRLTGENWSRLEAELTPSTGVPANQLHGSRVVAAQMPADWRAWSGFATVWLHREDWMEMLAPQRLALLRWVAQGGELYLAGPSRGLTDLPALRPRSTNDGRNEESAAYVFGTITRIDFEDEGNGGPRLPIRMVAERIRHTAHTSPALARLTNDLPTTEAERDLGPIEPGGILLGSLIAVIAILLGPVNIFALAPPRRRARLFITVPLISVGGALALVGLILVQDGVGGAGQRGVLIALIPNRPEALVLQEQTARTGLLLGSGFNTAEELTLVDYTDAPGDQGHFGYAYGTQRNPRAGLDRAGGAFSGNWFASRTLQSHHLRSFMPTRAALTLSIDRDGRASVLSTCPATLREVTILDATGRMLHAVEVPPGRTVELLPIAPEDRPEWRAQLTHFGASFVAAGEQNPAPLTFRAIADRWDESIPFATLSSITWRNDRIAVMGPVRLKE